MTSIAQNVIKTKGQKAAETRAISKARHAEFKQRFDFFNQAIYDLAEGKTTLETIKQNELWEKLITNNMEYGQEIITMAKAVDERNKPLIDLILARQESDLTNLRGNCINIFENWLQKFGNQNIIDLYHEINWGKSCMEWEKSIALGHMFLKTQQHKKLYGYIKNNRTELEKLSKKLLEDNPDIKPKYL